MKTIVKFGLTALAVGAFIGLELPVKADPPLWLRSQQDYFRARGLVPPGSYAHNENQKTATIAVNNAGQGVAEQKQTTSKPAKKKHTAN
jgi:hypothetical protein